MNFRAALMLLPAALWAQPPLDLLLRGGQMIDGSGAAARMADIGIRGDRIVFIGDGALRIFAGRAGVRRSAARRDRARAGPAGDDSGGRVLDPRGDPVPEDSEGAGPDVRSAFGGAGAAVARAGDQHSKT